MTITQLFLGERKAFVCHDDYISPINFDALIDREIDRVMHMTDADYAVYADEFKSVEVH